MRTYALWAIGNSDRSVDKLVEYSKEIARVVKPVAMCHDKTRTSSSWEHMIAQHCGVATIEPATRVPRKVTVFAPIFHFPEGNCAKILMRTNNSLISAIQLDRFD
jgi:hypothetical protein